MHEVQWYLTKPPSHVDGILHANIDRVEIWISEYFYAEIIRINVCSSTGA